MQKMISKIPPHLSDHNLDGFHHCDPVGDDRLLQLADGGRVFC